MVLPEGDPKSFETWLNAAFKPRALEHHIRPKILTKALAEISFLPEILAKQANQKEFSLPIRDYLEIAASDERVRKGRKALRQNRVLFNRIEMAFGVEAEVVVAIWGLETSYGAILGETPTLSALATLAFGGHRAWYFEDELIAALRLIQSRNCAANALLGSWAGALGHGQFMPSALIDFAVDFDGDGRVNVCGEDPTDALASIANFLKKHEWKKGQPWGLEVRLPEEFDYARTGLDQTLPSEDWAKLGVITTQGEAPPDYGKGSILLPTGARGIALLVLRNFHVITRYNRSESYAIGVGHLSDRLLGAPPFSGPWPVADPVLTQHDVAEAQYLLTRAGFNTFGTDGLRGPNTLAAVRRWQEVQGIVPDGYLNQAVLEALRAQKSG